MERAFGTISSIVGNLAGNASLQKAIVFAAWKQAAGEQLQDRAIAYDYVDGRLMIAVEDATWKTQMEALAPALLAALNVRLNGPDVKYLEFHAAPFRFEKKI